MFRNCEVCGITYEREGGFFLGSIYFNYGLTALIAAVVYPLALFMQWLPIQTLNIVVLAFSILFPIWFFRYARALWMGFDQFWDPRPGTESFGGSGKPEG
jgi:hypothetical protein